MKKFFYKSIMFSVGLISLAVAFTYLSTTDKYRNVIARITDSEEFIASGLDEIKPYVEKVQEKNDYTKLIIGDSVCHQMFNNLQEYNDEYCIVGSNGAISMAGQYILAEQFIESHNNAKEIYIIMVPGSIGAGIGSGLAYQYVVMPFTATDTLQLLDEDTINYMKNIYGQFFMKKDVVWLLNKSTFLRKAYLNSISRNTSNKSGITPNIPLTYLEKIKALCQENNVDLFFLPAPVMESRKEQIANTYSAYKDTIFCEYFPEYFSSVAYYPDEQFGDGSHFGGSYADQAEFNKKILEIYSDSNILSGLKFE